MNAFEEQFPDLILREHVLENMLDVVSGLHSQLNLTYTGQASMLNLLLSRK